MGGWQEYSNVLGKTLEVVPDDDLLLARLGPIGTTGLTAYFGLLKIGKPEPGDTVVVSGAAGAVGSMVGQIAKIAGCRTVGIAGGPEKCAWLVDEVGYDAAIDYKNENIKARLKEYMDSNGLGAVTEIDPDEFVVLARAAAITTRTARCGTWCRTT